MPGTMKSKDQRKTYNPLSNLITAVVFQYEKYSNKVSNADSFLSTRLRLNFAYPTPTKLPNIKYIAAITSATMNIMPKLPIIQAPTSELIPPLVPVD